MITGPTPPFSEKSHVRLRPPLQNVLRRLPASSFAFLVAATLTIASARGEESHVEAHTIEITGFPNRPIWLGIRLPATVDGDETFVLLKNVPDKAKPNVGIDVGNGGWLIAASSLDQLAITTPHPGHVRMTVQLLDAHFIPVTAEKPIRVHVLETASAAQLGN